MSGYYIDPTPLSDNALAELRKRMGLRHAPAVPVGHIDPDDPDLSMAWADMDSWLDEQQEDDAL